MNWQRILHSVKDGPAKDISLGMGTAITVFVRVGSYGLVAIAGVVMARALGAHDRGIYSLVTTVALLFAAFSELGLSKAGIYLVGQKRFSLQSIISNNLAWWLTIGTIWIGGSLTLALVRPSFVPDELGMAHFLVFALGGALLLFLVMAEDLLLTTGSIIGYNVVRFVEPFMRAVLVIGGVTIFGLGIVGVLSMWLLAIAASAIPAFYLLMKRARPVPRIQTKALKSQLSFGLRSNFGFVLEAANHRLDVFLVAGIAGTAALGHYAVAFGAAELLWRITFALGAVFFPKVAALDSEANAETAATTLRRALFIILLATLIILPFGRLLIGGLYGEEFLPGVNAFYILAPSALLYTVFRILNASLAGMGRPESGIYAGVVSLPLTIGLSLLLIPRMGIVGAAIASMAAYGAAAAVVLVMFLWVTRKSLMETLVINRDDITSSIQTARTLLARSEAT